MTISIRTVLWISWARNAIRGAGRAAEARRRYVRAPSDGTDAGERSSARGDESDEAMQAICAAVFAAEALFVAIADIVVPNQTLASWRAPGRRTPAMSQLREAAKHSINNQILASDVADQWKAFYSMRDPAVHFREHDSEPVPGPVGANVSPEHATYSAESAIEAVELLFQTLDALTTDHKPTLATWAASHATAVNALADDRLRVDVSLSG